MITDTESFIKAARAKHGDKFDYSLTEYKNAKTKITTICPIHGISKQYPHNHIKRYGCPTCGNKASNYERKKTTEDFIREAKEIHGDRYDYSLVDYKNARSKVTIICPDHGEFKQFPNIHKRSYGCPRCGHDSVTLNNTKTTKDFIKDAKSVHGDKFDYSLVEYKNWQTKVKIICPTHGMFKQTPNSHLSGSQCAMCVQKRHHSTNEFIELSKEKHGNKYDYNLVDYKKGQSKVKIICPDHGVFEQLAHSHLQGRGCSYCDPSKKLTTEYFIEKAKNKHGDTYDYSLVNYKNTKTPIKIICKTHGVFLQTPANHLLYGCSKCASASVVSLKEQEVVDYITSIYSGTLETSNRQIIKPKELDIVLPELKLAIEFDGIYWHSDATNTSSQYHLNKTKACLKKGYKLIHIFEDEWNDNKEAVKLILERAIDPNAIPNLPDIVSISVPSNTDYQDFLNTYHIEGYTPSDLTCAITHNNALIASLGLSYSNDDALLIDRFLTTHNATQSLSTLLSYVQRTHKPSNISVEADRRFSEGDLYQKSGFTLVESSKPQTHYIYGSQRITKDIPQDAPKIWDCGYHTFTLQP